MKTLKAIPGQNLFLGNQGENLALQIVFDIAPWLRTYGPGTVHLLHQRNGDAEPYPVVTVQEGTLISWDVTDADTAVEGYGKYELRYYAGETMVKSSVGETFTNKALQYGSDAPDPIKGWVDHVLEMESEIYEAVNETKRNSEQAASAAEDALSFSNAAEKSAKFADIQAKTAEDFANDAMKSMASAYEHRFVSERASEAAKASAEEAKKAAENAGGGGSGISVTAKPGQFIRVKEVDENGKPTAWEAVDPVTGADWNAAEGEPGHVLNRTHWVEQNSDFIAEIQKRSYSEENVLFTPVVGEEYIVTFGENSYPVVAKRTTDGGAEVVYIGNASIRYASEENTGEPWVYYGYVFKGVAVAAALDTDEASTAKTISVYQNTENIHKLPGKFLPDGVPYVENGCMVEILPETQLLIENNTLPETYITEPFSLTIGETYTVNLSGDEYKCECIDAKVYDESYSGVPGLLNEGADLTTGEGLIFGVLCLPDGPIDNVYGVVLFVNKPTEATIAIYQDNTIIHKLDKKFLPEESILYTPQDLPKEKQKRARANIGAVSMEEVEELLGIEEEFSASGDVVEFDFDVEPDTALQVISKIHRDETWGLSDKLVLHQVSGSNFADLSSWLGGAGTVFEKDGLTVAVNADSTVTIRGTNENSDWSYPINITNWTGDLTEKVYPAGTYSRPDDLMIYIRAARYPNNDSIAGFTSNLGKTVTIPEPFRIVQVRYSVMPSATVDVTLPLGLFRGSSVPETGYEYSGVLHTATFDSPIYEGEFNWSTGELKDTEGNTVGYYDVPEIKRLSGTNYFWTGFGENTVSNASNDLGKVILRLNETAPTETVASVCDFTLTPTTPQATYCLHDAKVRNGGVFFTHEIPLITTKGTLSIVDSNGEVTTEKYVDPLINWQGVSDTLTNEGVHKVWSGKFYFTKEPVAQEDFSDINNAVYTFAFTEDDFRNVGIPAKLDNIPIVSPCFYTGADAASKINERVWGGGVFPATFSWDSSAGKYIFKVRGLYPGNIMPQLTNYTKGYFHYQLETPYDEPTTVALGISSGDTVTFTVDDSDWRMYLDGELYSSDSSADATPGIYAYITRNAEDACGGMINVARMLNNAGKSGGDATVQGYSWIGKGDGVTDYTARIQSKLDELHTASNGGTIYLGPGVYPISGNLLIYDNTRIIGDGQTVIEQIADNTHAFVVCGSDVTIEELSIKLSGACSTITACTYVNSYNKPSMDNYNAAFPETGQVKRLTIENVHMSGTYYFGEENGYPIVSDAYENYMGVGIYSDKGYFVYAHVDNVCFSHLRAGIHGAGGSSYYNVTSEFCKYGLYIDGGGDNVYFVNGHSYYAIDINGKHITMSDAIAHVENDSHSNYCLKSYDVQAYKIIAYLGPRTRANKIDIQTVGLTTSHEWDILSWFVKDYGRKNIVCNQFKTTVFEIGSQINGIAGNYDMKLSDPVIQNALSGAGIWGNISSNVEFENCGITLRDVCRYPSEKAINNRLPYILSTATLSDDNPIEIVIDYSNRPVVGIPNYFIQFHNGHIAADYVVSFDTTNTGDYDFELHTIGNSNVVEFQNEPQTGTQYITYRMKFRFTKPLQIPNLIDVMTGETFNYNPEGLIGICNIGMTANDYAGRSFLGECGGSLYGNVDMHQNTFKNLSDPVDAGDAVSKSYLEARLQDIETSLDAIIEIQNELIGGNDV